MSRFAPASPPPAPFPRELVGRHRYRLRRQIGRGGFGSVFLASCEDPGAPAREVAVKILRAPSASDEVAALKLELSALLALRHDRIPRVYDWNAQPTPSPFVVMQYYPEGSTRDLFLYDKVLDETAAWRLLVDLLLALRAAHRASILHLDIKPSNVLFDGLGGYVLTDFGISRTSQVSRHLVPITGTGTPGYQAPEQRWKLFDLWDSRTDLWGVGATTWSLLTGINLFSRYNRMMESGDGDGEVGLPPLAEMRPDISPALCQIVDQMLAVAPEERPGGAAEVLARIEKMTAGLAGLSAPSYAALHTRHQDDAEVVAVIDSLVDPLWSAICRGRSFERSFVKFENGDYLMRVGEKSYFTHVLLRGEVEVERDGQVLTVETREGTFLGEVATLTGEARTASLRARGTVWTVVFNAAEFERFITLNPPVAMRLVKSLAERLGRESTR